MATMDEVAPVSEGKECEKSVNEPTFRDSSLHSAQKFGDDIEKHGAGPESSPLPDLKRKLKSRHLQMIAIGWFKASIYFQCTRLTYPRWHHRNGSLHR